MTQDQTKNATPGRKYDQPSTGSNSAGSMGAGGTGDAGSLQGGTDGAQQSAGRTDDLLSGDSDAGEASKGFAGGQGKAEQGSRQSADPAKQIPRE